MGDLFSPAVPYIVAPVVVDITHCLGLFWAVVEGTYDTM